MTFVLLADKPSHAFDTVRQASGRDERIPSNPFPVAYVNSFFGMVARFDWPRSTRWADLPVVSDPTLRHLPASEGKIAPILLDPLSCRAIREDRGGIDGRIADAERILVATANRPSEIHVVENFLRGALGERYDEVQKDWTSPYEFGSPLLAWEEMVGRHLGRSMLMKRFLFSYSINATMLFGRAYEEVGLGKAGESIVKSAVGSASALQFLYHMRRVGETTYVGAIQTMDRWRGTGRYPSHHVGLSTARSRHLVVSNLIGAGLMADVEGDGPDRVVAITQDGRSFLGAIHPASEDPDQGFRLREWCALPYEDAKSRLDRYLLTYFRRQKSGRFAREFSGIEA